jgi:uncharacterized protein (TIGR00369 family)
MSEVPEGFERHFRRSPFSDPWEPIYSKRTARSVSVGLRLSGAHTNARGFAHAGLVASLADNAMGYSCAQATGWTTSYVTVSLSIDYLASGQLGQWLEVECDVIKTGGTLCFAQCLVKADGGVIARGSATFRVVPKPPGWPTAQH